MRLCPLYSILATLLSCPSSDVPSLHQRPPEPDPVFALWHAHGDNSRVFKYRYLFLYLVFC